ncbi:class I SAM-dependent methyltransferase [Bacillus sp. B-jedd]|uniref:class I SAM-dependent methyltransferase n=1 Tax=Bacillus sp. B-jedd TaxID=1476857 RepID=UPI0005155708|nr:class I SAM-dependent methyltransferase [Bacillus sp. B-jedd]CEG28889.1 ubiquinone/menaquinone biosynthesis methyltransferase UBIE [Bacillus sp. B-jedd]
MKDRIIEVFNKLSGAYEKSVDIDNLYNGEYERPAMLAELPEDLAGTKILDAGCAAGWYAVELANRGAKVAGIDISPEMVSAAKRRAGDKANIFCHDLTEALPFDDQSFDYVVSSLALHYLKDWSFTFSEFKRILKPDGMFLFSIHHPFTDIQLSENPNYFSMELIIDQWRKDGKLFDVPFYRRPLQNILNETIAYFAIEKVIEPIPTAKFKELKPESFEKLMKSPNFLIIKATSNVKGA